MKSVISFLVLGILVFVSAAQAQTSTPAKPNMFSLKVACEAALKSGNVRFYEPKYFGLNKKNPTNGADRVVVPLETNMCLHMFVVGGWKFVAQHEGTKFRADKLADGSLSVYARDDCGNPVNGLIFPGPKQSSPALVSQPTPPPVRQPHPPPVTVSELPPVQQPRFALPAPADVAPPQPPRMMISPPPPFVEEPYYPPPSPPIIRNESRSFCGKKCKWGIAALGGGAVAYTAWYYWPCPTGTIRAR